MRHLLKYLNVPSATRPVPHSTENPVPLNRNLASLNETTNENTAVSCESSEVGLELLDPPGQKFDQNDLSDLARDLGLSKLNSEILASRLEERNLLKRGTNITYYRKREQDFVQYFSYEEDFVFCHDVDGLLKELGLQNYDPTEWRLFIDSSKRSLKCVLLHNTNVMGSVPIGHSVTLKEEYESIKKVIQLLNYQEHNWIICVDLKMVCFLLGQQRGYTKYPCFLCTWDSRARNKHWIQKKWPLRNELKPGDPNILHEPLVDRNKIVLPPLHIKLGLMKQFVKALPTNGQCFKFLTQKFPGITIEKIQAGVFDGPQIRKLMADEDFFDSMNEVEKRAWSAFKRVVSEFLGNTKSEGYKTVVNDLLKSFKSLGCNMSIKLHFLNSHLDRFPENLGAVSDEQGERFHQDLKTMEERYQGRWDINMMADYVWSIKRDNPLCQHRRKGIKRKFLPTMN